MRNTRNKRSEAKSKNEKYEQKNNVKKLTKNRYLSSYHILFCFFFLSTPSTGWFSVLHQMYCVLWCNALRLRSFKKLRTPDTENGYCTSNAFANAKWSAFQN